MKCELDALPRPHYGYEVVHTARLAHGLGVQEFAALEFGVGKGRGLPEPKDYRDCPYLFRGAQYRMDQDALQKQLKSATLVIGDVEYTCSDFFDTYAPPPIGFMAFDLGHYSSTTSAFHLLNTANLEQFLPRALC